MNKLKVFKSYSKSGKEYYTFSTKAYQKEDKLTWFIKFVSCTTPIFQKGISGNREYEYVDIEPIDFVLGNTAEFNGVINPTITIFNYQEIKPQKSVEEKAKELARDNNAPYVEIKSEDLPFY